jgi:hypothetical protein
MAIGNYMATPKVNTQSSSQAAQNWSNSLASNASSANSNSMMGNASSPNSVASLNAGNSMRSAVQPAGYQDAGRGSSMPPSMNSAVQPYGQQAQPATRAGAPASAPSVPGQMRTQATAQPGPGAPGYPTFSPPPMQGGGSPAYQGSGPQMPDTGMGTPGLPAWNPPTTQAGGYAPPGGQQAPRTGAQGFFDTTDPWRQDGWSNKDYERLAALLPVAQLDQNMLQYMQDFNESQRRYDAGFGAERQDAAFNQDLLTRQQQAAEWQAQEAARQWGQQMGWTQTTDTWNRDLSAQDIANQYTMGMDRNQAERDVAGIQSQSQQAVAQTYADAQRYGAELGLRGAELDAYARQAVARTQADAQRDTTRMQTQAQLDIAGLESVTGLQQTQMQTQAQQAVANIYAQAQNYGAQLGLRGAELDAYARQEVARMQVSGQLGVAGLETSTQRDIARWQNEFQYAQLAQAAQQAQLERENQMSLAAIQAFGRSQAPQGNWSRNWG